MCSKFPIHTLDTRDLQSIFEVRNYLSKKFYIFSTHEIYFTVKYIANYGIYYSVVGENIFLKLSLSGRFCELNSRIY